MKVNFLLKGENNPTNIFCRFKPTQEHDFWVTTKLPVFRKDWSEKTQRVKQTAANKNKDLINNTLNDIQTTIVERWTEDIIKRNPIKKDWLKNVVDVYFGRAKSNEQYRVYLTEWVNKFVQESPKRLHKGKPLTARRIARYKLVQNRLLEFEKRTKTKIKLEHIDLNFYRDFVNWCKTYKEYNNNTIGGLIKVIKLWCKNIELEGLPINMQYKHSEFMAVSNKTTDVYLNEAEINQVFKHNFGTNLKLDKTRDLFIIGLRTGLRVSDFLRLNPGNIKGEFIEIETLKTKETVNIPMHNQVKAVLKKWGGKLPPRISDQKFNEYVKEVCKAVGITEPTEGAKINPETHRKESGIYPKYELVSSHTCRRSFASNLYGKLPNLTIMAVTGHQTETVFLKYIKMTKQEHAQTLSKYWRNAQAETGHEPFLKVVE